MPVFEQGYRPYTGPVRRGSRSLAIAWESLRPRLRWWVWLLMFPFLFFPHLMIAGFVYAFLVLGQGLPTIPVDKLDVVYTTNDPMRRMLASLSGTSPGLYWELLNTAFSATGPVVVCAVVCAGILSSDRRTNALHLYFSRPVTRRDYLVGKTLTVAAFCSILTAIPVLLLWGEVSALKPDFAHVAATWWVPFAIVGASAVYALWTAGLVLFFSSVLDRPVLTAVATIGVYLFLMGLGATLSRSMEDKTWNCLIPHYAIGGLTAPLFGLGTPDWLPLPLCAIGALGVPALCFAVVVRRLRAVEVVT